MTETILMIEDEPGLVLAVGDRLLAEGYLLDSRPDGISGEKAALSDTWKLIIIDAMISDRGGFIVCKNIRDAGIKTPILMLTALDQVKSRVDVLKIGADDYLSKPFEMSELVARIKALIRRSQVTTSYSPEQRVSSPIIDLERGIITHRGKETVLSTQEVKLLIYFFNHQEKPISRQELLKSVWKYDSNSSTRTIDVHVGRLRKKMGDTNTVPRYIHTIYGVGYKFTPPL